MGSSSPIASCVTRICERDFDATKLPAGIDNRRSAKVVLRKPPGISWLGSSELYLRAREDRLLRRQQLAAARDVTGPASVDASSRGWSRPRERPALH